MLDLTKDGVQCPPQTETLAYADWIKRDQVLLTWINSTLPMRLLVSTKEFTSGRALWFHLENLVGDEHMTYAHGLRDRLTNLDYDMFDSTAKYINNAKLIANALAKAGWPVGDSELISFLLNRLPDSYEDFVIGIRDRPEPVTLQELEKLLTDHIPRELVRLSYMAIITFFWSMASVIFFTSNPDAIWFMIYLVYTVVSVGVAVGLAVVIVESRNRGRAKRSAKTYKRLPDLEQHKSHQSLINLEIDESSKRPSQSLQ